MLQNEKYILVDSNESLAKLLEDLSMYEMAAVDTEADSMYHYAAKLCLIQITIGEHHYIVDPLCGIDITPLFKAKAMQTLIFHGADYDLRLLWQTYGFSPKYIFDTMLAAKLLNEPHVGLANLVYKYFGDELKKENQRADWTIRPLSLEMCEYAIHDTFYLHELCAVLAQKLKDLGRMSWLIEECLTLIENAKIPSQKKYEPWRISGSAQFLPCELNYLKFIWEWREFEAQKLDKPPYKVMSGELMLALARHMPKIGANISLETLHKFSRNFKFERLDSFLEMLHVAQNVAESAWPKQLQKTPPPETNVNTDLLLLLKEWRDSKALELQIESSMISNKSQLVWLACANDTPWNVRYEHAHLMNWQRSIWNNILMQHLT